MENNVYCKINPEVIATLLSDYYKQGHAEFYPKGLNYLATYGTARMTRIPEIDHMVVFGSQMFAMKYLVDYFDKNFFKVPKETALATIKYVIDQTFVCPSFSMEKLEKLHDLGYLPIRMYSLPEGSKVKIYNQKKNSGVVQVPFMMYENTHPDFAWVAEFLESITSVSIWYTCLIATISHYGYRKVVDKHWEKSVVGQPANTAISEFGFRGGEMLEGAVAASLGFLTSFSKTATLPAVCIGQYYYGDGMELKEIGGGMNSTEHSVMCSNYAVDGDEVTFVKRLLTEIAPHGNISMVTDSYDYWNLVTNILGSEEIKNIVLNRNGTLYVRGDSGNPVDIICGTLRGKDYIELAESTTEDEIKEYCKKRAEREYKYDGADETWFRVRVGDYLYKVNCEHLLDDEDGVYWRTAKVEYVDLEKEIITPEMKGTIECLWDIYGGTINEKGYKVLEKHIRGIYGDSITPMSAEEIYTRLEEKKLAANNVALGAGSFSMQAWEEPGEYGVGKILKPHTRDTFGIAFKATYCEVQNEDGTVDKHNVFKDPKTDTAKFKKSQRGMVKVYWGEDGEMHAVDHLDREAFEESIKNGTNLLRPIFENGRMVYTENLRTIRDRLNEVGF